MNLEGLLVDPLTAAALLDIAEHPAHALLLIGPDGSGKGTVAQHLAAHLLQVDIEKLLSHPYFMRIEPEEKAGSLTIENIRRLHQAVQLKTLGSANAIRRVLVIKQAHTMTIEAQNALLKILEEPPADTVIILTAISLRSLLTTIISRVQQLTIRTPSLQTAQHFLASTYSASAVERAFRLSGGAPALLIALLSEDTSHPLVEALSTIKQWLQQSSFERLAQIDSLIKNKADLQLLLVALARTAEAALTQAAARGQKQLLVRWQKILASTTYTQMALASNAQAKLAFTKLMLEL